MANNVNGTGFDDTLTGTAGDDAIYAYQGNDTLVGFTGDDALISHDGFDLLIGDTGDDTYVVGKGFDPDIISETDPDDVDRILAYASWNMGTYDFDGVNGADAANMENIRLVSLHLWSDTVNGTFTGKFIVEKINATGNALDNIMEGDKEANTLTGGLGDDTYIIHDLLGATNHLGASIVDTIIEIDPTTTVGSGGNDTILFTPLKTAILPFFLPDASVATNQVENLTFGGAIAYNGVGNDLDNTLTGNSGANIFDGGDGNDLYVVGSSDKIMFWNGSAFVTGGDAGGVDTVEANFTYTIAARIDLENITLVGVGNFNAIGNANSNFLIGNNSNNTLDAGVAGAADTFFGYGGNDIYIINNSNSVVLHEHTLRDGTLYSDGGQDTIKTSVNYDCEAVVAVSQTLALEVEDVILTGTALYVRGNAENNKITGNVLANTLHGGSAGNDTLLGLAGNDTLYASGGTCRLDGGVGADTMFTGNGNDIFIVDNAGDFVLDGVNGGVDGIMSSVTFDMNLRAPGTGQRALTLTGGASINGTANDNGVTLIGNTGTNILTGGAGDDTVTGSGGTDKYVGNAGGDTFIGGVGNDLMIGDDKDLLLWVSGTVLSGDDSLSGGNGADTLFGGNGNDSLSGGGHADIMRGEEGDDIYDIVDLQDLVIETGASTGDIVKAHINYTLNSNVEILNLVAGTTGTGNSLNNIITGNGGNNTLNGVGGVDTITGNGGNDVLDGGALADTMTGGAGTDTFIADDAADLANSGGGISKDTVRASVNYDLSASAATVHNLTLTGSTAVTATGSALDNVITGNGILNTLIGGDGNDTYMMDNIVDNIIEILDTSTVTGAGLKDCVMSSVNFYLDDVPYAGQEIENLTLTGLVAVFGTGNDLNNTITGNGLSNTLEGLLGDDTYVIGAQALTGQGAQMDVILDDSGGTDTVSVASTYSIALRPDLENITLTGAAHINATGNANVNIIAGNAGNNTLDGGTGEDTYFGSMGNDVYYVDAYDPTIVPVTHPAVTGDTVIEDLTLYGPDGGTDLVISSVDYDMSILAINVENLTLTGTAVTGTGNAFDNVITGDDVANTLSGLGGADTINGGLGADSMIGGLGNDTYFVNDAADFIIEVAAQGTTDTVLASADYSMLANALEVEKLTLTGTALVGTGNVINNIITGNALANTLYGKDGDDTIDGGAGADTMLGELGNDTFMVDSFADYVSENGSEGTDDLIKFTATAAGVTYTLNSAGRLDVENLTLLGAVAVNGTGNTLVNVITGNSSVNTLDGGTSADTMFGGGGNDTYFVDNANDVVVGTGHILASISYDMGANATVTVFLTLTGATADLGTGNSLGNTITGQGAADFTFDGGGGNDVFILNNINNDVVDVVDTGVDLIMVSSALGSSYDMAARAASVDSLTVTGLTAFDVYDNDEANTLTGNGAVNTFYGSDGNDTYFVDATDVVVDTGTEVDPVEDIVAVNFTADLTAGVGLQWSGVGGITLLGAVALKAFGDANANILTGNTAANVLDGRGGDDTMIGGAGNDTYWVDSEDDIINEVTLGGAGKDIVFADGVDYTLSQSVDNLTLVGPLLDLEGYGNTSINIIIGTSGNNYLDGDVGADTLNGGLGNDTYVVDTAQDVLQDSGGTADKVISKINSYTLLSAFEHLTLSDAGSIGLIGIGNSAKNIITGDAGPDTLSGLGGDDTLLGKAGDDKLDGGTGNDTMTGGDGNDTYTVDSLLDVVVEIADTDTLTAGAGTEDLIITKFSYSLAAMAGSPEVEGLTLTAGIFGTGNGLNNFITGNASANTLSGGAGDDVLDGGLGRDFYIGGSGSDFFYIGVDAVTNHDTIADSDGFDILVYDSLFIDYEPLEDVLDDFLAYRWDGTNSLAYVDRDGVTGTAHGFQLVAVILGVDVT